MRKLIHLINVSTYGLEKINNTENKMTRIYTSHYSNIRNLNRLTMTPIGISRIQPRWYNGLMFLTLAPSKDLLYGYKNQYISEDEYRIIYNSMINNLDPSEIYTVLFEMANSKIPVLCCYESPDKFCHRNLVSEWFSINGIKCTEFTK